MSSHLRFNEDHSDYDPSDSDEDYTENEKILLNKVRNRKTHDSESEQEVFGVGSDESDIALSDVEGQEDKDDVPDVRAWGKDKRKFYSTDYVDPDYGGFQGKDAHLAELEEEEARSLQQQLAQQLDDDDFNLDITIQRVEDEKKAAEEVIKSDVSKLTKRQKLQILQKESPEFFGLVEDFKAKMSLAKDSLKPILTKYKKGQLPNSPAMDFVLTQYELILNYCVNIYMYLLLKSSRVNVQNHPVVKRLYQYRQLLSQLEPIYESTLKPQIETLLAENSSELEVKKTLNIVKNIENQKPPKASKKKKQTSMPEEIPSKRVKFDVSQEIEDDDGAPGKRAITYQIAKNKGLTPHRKREQRNPRVKHRNKFRKAKIRRKGAVREPRKELQRYGGEISGIKASVSKSIKIKT